MASSDSLSAADTTPLQTDGGEIEMVNDHLGSVISRAHDGEILEDLK